MLKKYTHRIGRTARAGKKGSTVHFVSQYDLELLQRLEFGLKRKFTPIEFIDYSDYENIKDVYEEISLNINQNKKLWK